MNFKTCEKEMSTKHMLMLLLAVKLLGIAYATQVFAQFSPLVDSELYIKGFYYHDQFLRTRAIQWMAAIPNLIGGAYMAHLVFALISVVGLAYYYVTGGRRWGLALTLLLPSSLVWTSIVGKEAIFVGGMGLTLVVWSKYAVKPLDWFDIALAVLAFCVCTALRPHYAIAVAWLFFATALLKHLKCKAGPVLIIFFITGVVAVYLTAWNDLLDRGYGAIDYTARASRHGILGITPSHSGGYVQGFQQFKSWVPLGVLFGIVGPFPSEVGKRLELLPFFLEGLLILFSPLFILFWEKRHNPTMKSAYFRVFGWCLVPAILMLMLVHAPFGILNPGSATRWRTNFEQMFYLAPLLLMYRFMDDSPPENHSLSPER